MKSSILVAVILQLVIIAIQTVDEYKFGDIIEFPRKCIGKKPLFSHFAIYVGKGTNDDEWRDVGQGDNDIFHRVAHLGKKGCKFGKLAKTGSKHRKKNYFDYVDLLTANRTSDKIAERIRAKNKNCGNYGPTNNCEHTATYVRYNISCSLQKGTRTERFLRKIGGMLKKEIIKKCEAVMNISADIFQEDNNNTLCSSDARKQVSGWPVLSACLALCCLLSGSCGF